MISEFCPLHDLFIILFSNRLVQNWTHLHITYMEGLNEYIYVYIFSFFSFFILLFLFYFSCQETLSTEVQRVMDLEHAWTWPSAAPFLNRESKSFPECLNLL